MSDSPTDMTVAEARRVIRDGTQRLARQVKAATLLCRPSESSLVDLLVCLQHPNRMVFRPAAAELHRRTGRPEEDRDHEFLITDYQDWCEYLRQKPSPVSEAQTDPVRGTIR